MAIEKSWPAVPPQLFTANGTTLGVVTIGNTAGFKVKQTVVVQSVTPAAQQALQVKRIISSTQMILGPLAQDIHPTFKQQGNQLLSVRADLSAYTVAAGSFVFAAEQPKVTIKPDDIIQAVYRQEPGTTIGVELDDQYGTPFSLENPLPIATVPLWDEIDLAYDVNQNLQVVTYKKNGQTFTLTLTYDSNQNLITVIKS